MRTSVLFLALDHPRIQTSVVIGAYRAQPQNLEIPAPSIVPAPKYLVFMEDHVASSTSDLKTSFSCDGQ